MVIYKFQAWAQTFQWKWHYLRCNTIFILNCLESGLKLKSNEGCKHRFLNAIYYLHFAFLIKQAHADEIQSKCKNFHPIYEFPSKLIKRKLNLSNLFFQSPKLLLANKCSFGWRFSIAFKLMKTNTIIYSQWIVYCIFIEDDQGLGTSVRANIACKSPHHHLEFIPIRA